MNRTSTTLLAALLLALTTAAATRAQTPPPAPPPSPASRLRPLAQSPQVLADRRVTFRLFAPGAPQVRVTGSDIPGIGQGLEMVKGEEAGLWEVTVGPLDPGAYRYLFNVAGVLVADPRNPATSESNDHVWSLAYVPGSDVSDTRDVPHGAVSEITYYSTVLGRFRRMHVYTPPGYENNRERYPVFYLLHGAGDSDDAWTTVGRAGFILDNLIADKKAKPMIVAMPAGHIFPRREPRAVADARPPVVTFEQEFLADILPHVEKRFRIRKDRKSRAIAGLSMGGNQTLNIAVPHLDRFAYVGVFSSAAFGAFPARRPGGGTTAAPVPTAPSAWEQQHMARLQDARLKKDLKLLWFGTGREDFLVQASRSTVDLLKKYGFSVVYEETGGGHTWAVWRDYLAKFAPMLFR